MWKRHGHNPFSYNKTICELLLSIYVLTTSKLLRPLKCRLLSPLFNVSFGRQENVTAIDKMFSTLARFFKQLISRFYLLKFC